MAKNKIPRGFLNLLGQIWGNYKANKERRAVLMQQVENVVDIADPEIRKAKGYRKQLIGHITGVKEYCTSILDSIPGPVQLASGKYFDDPTVKALFVSPEHLQEVLKNSPEVKDLQGSGYRGEIVALLTMTMEEKTVFGQERQGEMILQDVAKRAVNFIDHRLIVPSVDLASAKRNLAEHGLEVLGTFAMEKISSMRSKIAGLKEKREYLKAAVKILGGKGNAYYRYTVPDRAMQEKLDKAVKGLQEIEEELAEAQASLSSPEDALQYLTEIIMAPAKVITIQPQVLQLNWMNVKVDQLSGEGQRIVLAEFNLPDDVKRSAIFVSFLFEPSSPQ